MNRVIFIIYISVSILLSSVIQAFGTDIYRLLDPINGGRYGKSPDDGPPFLRFGSMQQYYHIADNEYDDYLTAVSNVFSNWNNAGVVQFSSSQSSGLALDVFYSSYGSPGIVNPGRAYPADNNYILDLDDSYIELNTYHDWYLDGTHDLEEHDFDVETILVHEAGHIHGLAHPLTNSYTHDVSAPIMAGGDNEYFWDHTAQDLRIQDVRGTRFLQLHVPDLYSSIPAAINDAVSGQTVHVYAGVPALTSNVIIPSGIILKIHSGATVNLNGYAITCTGSSKIINNGTVSGYTHYAKSGSDYKGFFSSSITIQQIIDWSTSGWDIYVGTGTFTENINMKAGVDVVGSGVNSTIINGTINFNNDDNASLSDVKIKNKITVNNSDGAVISSFKAGHSNCYIDVASTS